MRRVTTENRPWLGFGPSHPFLPVPQRIISQIGNS
jgi:hypothetical protein